MKDKRIESLLKSNKLVLLATRLSKASWLLAVGWVSKATSKLEVGTWTVVDCHLLFGLSSSIVSLFQLIKITTLQLTPQSSGGKPERTPRSHFERSPFGRDLCLPGWTGGRWQRSFLLIHQSRWPGWDLHQSWQCSPAPNSKPGADPKDPGCQGHHRCQGWGSQEGRADSWWWPGSHRAPPSTPARILTWDEHPMISRRAPKV